MLASLLTGSLLDPKGKILVPGMSDDVAPVTDEELKQYEKIEFDLDEYCKDVGVGQLLHDSKALVAVDMRRHTGLLRDNS